MDRIELAVLAGGALACSRKVTRTLLSFVSRFSPALILGQLQLVSGRAGREIVSADLALTAITHCRCELFFATNFLALRFVSRALEEAAARRG